MRLSPAFVLFVYCSPLVTWRWTKQHVPWHIVMVHCVCLHCLCLFIVLHSFSTTISFNSFWSVFLGLLNLFGNCCVFVFCSGGQRPTYSVMSTLVHKGPRIRVRKRAWFVAAGGLLRGEQPHKNQKKKTCLKKKRSETTITNKKNKTNKTKLDTIYRPLLQKKKTTTYNT